MPVPDTATWEQFCQQVCHLQMQYCRALPALLQSFFSTIVKAEVQIRKHFQHSTAEHEELALMKIAAASGADQAEAGRHREHLPCLGASLGLSHVPATGSNVSRTPGADRFYALLCAERRASDAARRPAGHRRAARD